MARKCKIIKKITRPNRQGLVVAKTDNPGKPYFYYDPKTAFVLSTFRVKSQAIKAWGEDNTPQSDGKWASDFSGI